MLLAAGGIQGNYRLPPESDAGLGGTRRGRWSGHPPGPRRRGTGPGTRGGWPRPAWRPGPPGLAGPTSSTHALRQVSMASVLAFPAKEAMTSCAARPRRKALSIRSGIDPGRLLDHVGAATGGETEEDAEGDATHDEPPKFPPREDSGGTPSGDCRRPARCPFEGSRGLARVMRCAESPELWIGVASGATGRVPAVVRGPGSACAWEKPVGFQR